MYSMPPSSPENFSRAAARMNRTTIAVGAEPNSALVQLDKSWAVPGRKLPQSGSRLFATWKWRKLMHAGPDPAKIYSRVLNALHPEQSLGNCRRYFRYFSDSQHHSVIVPNTDLTSLSSHLQMQRRRILEVGDRDAKPETLRDTEVSASQRPERNDGASSASELKSQRREKERAHLNRQLPETDASSTIAGTRVSR